MKKSFIYTSILAVALLFVGCSEDELIENPPNFISAENLFVDAVGFEAGLNGLYALYRRERGGIGGFESNNDLLIGIAIAGTDNAYGNQRSGWNRVGNEYNVRNTTNESHNRQVFEWAYEIVNSANTIIGRSDNPAIDWTDEEKNRVIAEARLFRAYAYRHLTYLYGDVPLVLEESTGASVRSDFTRTPIAEVRAQMLDDFLFAEANLPETSDNPGKFVRGVATHYLAEHYLVLEDFASSITKANDLINSGIYSLITERYGVAADQPGTPFTDMFKDGNSNKSEGNTEALLVIQNQLETNGGGNNIMRRWFRSRSHQFEVNGDTGAIIFTVENGGRGLGRVGPTAFALSLYEPSDDRGGRFAWRTYEVLNNPDFVPEGFMLGDTVFIPFQGQTEPNQEPMWPSTRKWDYANPNDLAGARSFNDQVYLRLAETYLVLAEAQLKAGNPDAAATAINTLRTRANTSLITGADVDIDFILDERSRELWSEEHRRYVLVRNNAFLRRYQLGNVRYRDAAAERDALMPIPQSVIDANTIPMEQNPGYN